MISPHEADRRPNGNRLVVWALLSIGGGALAAFAVIGLALLLAACSADSGQTPTEPTATAIPVEVITSIPTPTATAIPTATPAPTPTATARDQAEAACWDAYESAAADARIADGWDADLVAEAIANRDQCLADMAATFGDSPNCEPAQRRTHEAGRAEATEAAILFLDIGYPALTSGVALSIPAQRAYYEAADYARRWHIPRSMGPCRSVSAGQTLRQLSEAMAALGWADGFIPYATPGPS